MALPASAVGNPQSQNESNGKCLDADLNNIWSNGDRAQLWDCSGGANQQWAWGTGSQCSNPAEVVCELINQYSGKCLDADSTGIGNNGDTVQLWDCWGGANQMWHIGWCDPGNPNYCEIINQADGKCLDADLNNINTNGDKVQLWDCWYTGSVGSYQIPAPNQAWSQF
jgi:endo-1,4-beta-xylanase